MAEGCTWTWWIFLTLMFYSVDDISDIINKFISFI